MAKNIKILNLENLNKLFFDAVEKVNVHTFNNYIIKIFILGF